MCRFLFYRGRQCPRTGLYHCAFCFAPPVASPAWDRPCPFATRGRCTLRHACRHPGRNGLGTIDKGQRGLLGAFSLFLLFLLFHSFTRFFFAKAYFFLSQFQKQKSRGVSRSSRTRVVWTRYGKKNATPTHAHTHGNKSATIKKSAFAKSTETRRDTKKDRKQKKRP